MKLELYIWALGLEWQLRYKEMLTGRDVLWKVIGYRGIVSTACCEEVCTEQFTPSELVRVTYKLDITPCSLAIAHKTLL